MNETAIVKFLANLIPQDEYIRGYATFFTGTDIPVSEFDPIHLIEHVWMVEDAIAKISHTSVVEYAHQLRLVVGMELAVNYEYVQEDALFDLIHATPKQRSEAAVRALATPEQIGAWL